MKIINLPIEPLPQRYSIQWDNWFIDEFIKQKLDVKSVYGAEYNKIVNGAFLDVVKTNTYKLEQLQRVLDLISKDPDEKQIVFFHDLWFPGLEMLAYIRDGLGLKNLKICGCLHAGTYDKNDFLAKQGMAKWGEKLEESWFKIVDKIFVATEFHKQLLMTKREIDYHKIIVTGFPIYADEVISKYNIPKKDIIVFPHRLDEEKRPDLFDQLQKELITHPIFKDWVLFKTKDTCKDEESYYEMLARSKIAISFAEQETWGIAMQEAVFNGCFPIVPNRLSYPEMYLEHYIYNNWSELINIMEDLADKEESRPNTVCLESMQTELAYKGKNAIPNMIDQMKTL